MSELNLLLNDINIMHTRKQNIERLVNLIDENVTIQNPLVRQMITNREINTIKKGILTVAAYTEFPPIVYIKNGKYMGIDVDIIEAFAEICNLKVEYIKIDKFDGIWNLPELEISDISIGGIANALERGTDRTEWTMPYFYVHRSMIYNKKNIDINNSNFRFPLLGKNTIILGTKNSTGWTDGAKRRKQFEGDVKLSAMNPGTTNKEDVEKLKNGKIIGIMRGDFVAKAIVKQNDTLAYFKWNMLPELLPKDGEVFAFPTKLGSGIAQSLSSFITALIYENKLNILLSKHELIDDSDANEYYKPIPDDKEEVTKPTLIKPENKGGRLRKEIIGLSNDITRYSIAIDGIKQNNNQINIILISGCNIKFVIPANYPFKQPTIDILGCDYIISNNDVISTDFMDIKEGHVIIKKWSPQLILGDILTKINGWIIQQQEGIKINK